MHQTNPLDCTEPWSLSTLKHWCNERVWGRRQGNDFSNIALELDGIYWIITELKDYVIGISDTEAYKQILGVLLSSFISLECRTRLIQLALRYENREIIGCALQNMQTRHIVQALFLQDLGEFKYDQIWIAILTSKASVTNGVRICREEPACTGFYYSYDSLVDAWICRLCLVNRLYWRRKCTNMRKYMHDSSTRYFDLSIRAESCCIHNNFYTSAKEEN